MAKAVLLEEFHLAVLTPARVSDAVRVRIRRFVVSRDFRRVLQEKIRDAFATRPELKDIVHRLGW